MLREDGGCDRCYFQDVMATSTRGQNSLDNPDGGQHWSTGCRHPIAIWTRADNFLVPQMDVAHCPPENTKLASYSMYCQVLVMFCDMLCGVSVLSTLPTTAMDDRCLCERLRVPSSREHDLFPAMLVDESYPFSVGRSGAREQRTVLLVAVHVLIEVLG